MIADPIVEEVRAIREQLAAKFDFDIRKIVADAQQRQAASQARVVSFEMPNPFMASLVKRRGGSVETPRSRDEV